MIVGGNAGDLALYYVKSLISLLNLTRQYINADVYVNNVNGYKKSKYL